MNKPMRVRKMTIETERTFIFRNRSGCSAPAWCDGCGLEVQMASVDVAAHETGLSELAIYELIESGALHFTEDENRRVRVCLNSLNFNKRRAERRRTSAKGDLP